jgi:hypothetical protein
MYVPVSRPLFLPVVLDCLPAKAQELVAASPSLISLFLSACVMRVQAANFLDIGSMLELTCKSVANMIKGK